LVEVAALGGDGHQQDGDLVVAAGLEVFSLSARLVVDLSATVQVERRTQVARGDDVFDELPDSPLDLSRVVQPVLRRARLGQEVLV